MRTAVCFLAAFLGALSSPCLADVIVVDGYGGGDFDDLQDAIDFAVDGDTLLVRPDLYWSSSSSQDFLITNKALTIVADIPAGSSDHVAMAPLTVRMLAAGKTVTLRGLRVIGSISLDPTAPKTALTLISNAGHVWIEDCYIEGDVGVTECVFLSCGAPRFDPGVVISFCTSVSFVRCDLIGGSGTDEWHQGMAWGKATAGGIGVDISFSHVSFLDGTLQGGSGGSADDPLTPSANGAAGVRLGFFSTAFFSGCAVLGGPEGGAGTPGAGAPGDGLRVSGATASYLDCLFLGAPGAQDINAPANSVTEFIGTARHFELSSPVRELQPGVISLAGVPGDQVAFYWSFGGASVPLPGKRGWWLLDNSFLAGPFALGVITDPAGTLEIPFFGPDLVLPNLEAETFLLQAYFVNTDGVTLGPGTAFTLVDSAF